MSELQADTATAAYVRRQADAAGLTESAWLARHFRDAALSEYARELGRWYGERPGLLEAEIAEAEAASAEADAA